MGHIFSNIRLLSIKKIKPFKKMPNLFFESKGEVERTLVLLKPEAKERGLTGELIKIFEKKFNIVALKLISCTEDDLRAHYAEHVEKPFFPPMLERMMRGPVTALVLEGFDAF